MTSKTTDHPEQHARWYATEQLSIDIEMIRFRFELNQRFFKGETLLEVGPAEGHMTKLMVPCFRKITVVEGSESLLMQIPDHPNLTKVHSLFEEWNTSERFDTIVMDHILEHVDEPVQFLSKAKSLLSPEGVILVGVPNAISFYRLAAVKMGLLKIPGELDKRDLALGHQRVYDPETLRADLHAAGLNIMHFGGLLFKPLTYSQMERIMTSEMLKAFVQLGMDFPENAAELLAVCN